MAVHLRYKLWYISLPSSIKHQRVVEIRFFFKSKNYNFLDCDWFKRLLFSTNSVAKLLSDSSICQSLLKL